MDNNDKEPEFVDLPVRSEASERFHNRIILLTILGLIAMIIYKYFNP